MTAMLGELPTWKLEDLYSSPTGPDLDADLKRAAADAEAFAKDYEGKVASLDGKALGGGGRALREAVGPDGPDRLLRPALLRAEHGRSRARPLFAERVGGADRHRHQAGVLPARAQQARGCRPCGQAEGSRARQVWAVAARPAGLSPAPALRRDGEGAAREARRRPRRLVAPVRRDHRAAALSLPQRGADRAADPRQAVEQGRRRPQGCRQVVRQGAGRQHRDLLPGDQYVGQGQGDRGPLAQVSAAAVGDEPRQRGRGRGRRCARRVGEGRLSAPGAPLLQAQGQVVRRRQDAVLGPQRAAARARRSRHPVGRGREDRARRLPCLLARAGRCRPKILRHRLDRRAGAAGQVAGRLRPSDGAVGASLSAAELPGQGAGRHDAWRTSWATACTRCWRRSRAR